MRRIKWTYDLMYKYYTKQHIINPVDNPEMIAIVYESKRPMKKDQNKLEPFVKRNIIHVGHSSVQNDELFPTGLFLVYDDNASGNKFLYFVYPTRTECPQRQVVFTAANHFTFCENKTDKKHPCHFHRTLYACIDNIAEKEKLFRCDHKREPFATALMLPDDEPTVFKTFPAFKETLLNILKHPWTSSQYGGGAKKVPTQPHLVARPIQNRQFCTLWNEEGFKSLRAFGFKRGREYHWTVCIVENGRLIKGVLYQSFVFTTLEGDDHEVVLQQHVVQSF